MVEIKPDLSGEGLRVGIVRARFNESIGAAMLEACRKRLAELRIAALTVVSVPGSLEVPLALQKLANTEKYDALIALGAVIRGETYHFEIVANESATGLMQVQLDSGIPVANGILTADTEEQAQERAAEGTRLRRGRGGNGEPRQERREEPQMKSARSRARAFAVQALYAWQLSGEGVAGLRTQLAQSKEFAKADPEYFARLLEGTIGDAVALEGLIAPALDRKLKELSPVERGILLLAAFELKNAPYVPYRVVINEAVELAKEFGGTDGHKYVNGVLDKLVASLRPDERSRPKAR
jgi:6,7-dimethyl-8-ribityllumazine synthase/transcription antitermination factor NusB